MKMKLRGKDFIIGVCNCVSLLKRRGDKMKDITNMEKNG